MVFWSGERLADEGKRRKVVEDFNKDKIDCSAYTLTLGPEAFVTPDYTVNPSDSTKHRLDAPFEILLGGGERKIEGGSLIIPTGQFAFLLTEEYINIPKDAMGFISLKSGVKWQGLINVSGFHVDPGYSGRLIYSVYNAGPSSIHLNRGQDIFLLWIASLDRESSTPYIKEIKDPLVSIPNNMINNVDRRVHSLQALSDRLDKINTKVDLILGGAAMVGVVLGLVFAYQQLAQGEKPVENATVNQSRAR